MAVVRNVKAKDGDALLLVGTMKGAFVLRSNAARGRWDMGGPYFQGQAVYALGFDGRAGRRRIWAGTASEHWGPGLSSSDDFGANWTNPEQRPIRFPEGSNASLKKIWQIRPGRASEPDVLYAGVEPASLFVSRDAGESWQLNEGLWNHPHRPTWQPGGGGLCLHTIVLDHDDPDRAFVAISTAGVYRTDDGGKSWRARNHGVRADFLPDKHPEYGQCVHKIVMHRSRPGRLFLQNHWGLYRSDDAGDSWIDIAKNVPSDFGFAMTMHPHDPDTVYILPLESDAFRCTPEGKLRVYRTRNAGGSWEPLTKGLPQRDALETVLRDGMDADSLNPAGIYFGTRSGTLYGSTSGGAAWSVIRTGLPPIVCVKAARVGDPAAVRGPRRASGHATARHTTRTSMRAKATRAKAARGQRPGAKRAAVKKK